MCRGFIQCAAAIFRFDNIFFERFAQRRVVFILHDIIEKPSEYRRCRAVLWQLNTIRDAFGAGHICSEVVLIHRCLHGHRALATRRFAFIFSIKHLHHRFLAFSTMPQFFHLYRGFRSQGLIKPLSQAIPSLQLHHLRYDHSPLNVTSRE